MSGLKDKVVLVTGASSGIGKGTAIHMAGLGCKLSLVARNKAALEEVADECKKAGAPDVLVSSHDLALEEECGKAVEETVAHFGGLNVLVHAAGIVVNGNTMSLSVEDYDRCMNINARSAFIITQKVLPHLLETKGSIVHVSSVTGLRAFPNVVAYNMSKAAVDHLVRTCALEVASQGVRVNAVNPGVIVTEIHKRGGMSDEAYEKFLEHSKTTHAMGRVGSVDEVAGTIAFLASDQASFITGQTLAIDGGRSTMCPR